MVKIAIYLILVNPIFRSQKEIVAMIPFNAPFLRFLIYVSFVCYDSLQTKLTTFICFLGQVCKKILSTVFLFCLAFLAWQKSLSQWADVTPFEEVMCSCTSCDFSVNFGTFVTTVNCDMPRYRQAEMKLAGKPTDWCWLIKKLLSHIWLKVQSDDFWLLQFRLFAKNFL